jgi:hypothetical protein
MAGGYTKSSSDKLSKKIWHKSFRRTNQIKLIEQEKYLNDDLSFPAINEKSDPWNFQKDGKCLYYISEKDIRTELFSSMQSILNIPRIMQKYCYCVSINKFIVEELMNYYNIKDYKEIFKLSDKKIEKYIKYFFKKEKRK